MVLIILEALLTAIEATIQMNQLVINLTGYTEVTLDIINELLPCKNKSSKIESL